VTSNPSLSANEKIPELLGFFHLRPVWRLPVGREVRGCGCENKPRTSHPNHSPIFRSGEAVCCRESSYLRSRRIQTVPLNLFWTILIFNPMFNFQKLEAYQIAKAFHKDVRLLLIQSSFIDKYQKTSFLGPR
jgi:hypothetical protein